MLDLFVTYVYGSQSTPTLKQFSDNIDPKALACYLNDAIVNARRNSCSSVEVLLSFNDCQGFEVTSLFRQTFYFDKKNGKIKTTIHSPGSASRRR